VQQGTYAPRADDDVRCASDHFGRVCEDAIARARFFREFGKHIVAACDADQFGDSANAATLPLSKTYPEGFRCLFLFPFVHCALVDALRDSQASPLHQ
jgi:hypothetical protein